MERLTGTAKNTKVGSHYYYYADGRRVGDVSDNPSDNTRVSYAEQLATKRNAPVDQRNLYRSFKPVVSADFDQNFEPINESYPAASASSYTIRGGEDLPAIAQSLWGDRAMWYLIAEANGLRGNENLQAGQVLVIPNKVTNIHNNAETFRPYNAGEAIGKIDPTLPTAPPPPTQAGDKGCGTLGTVIMVVIAVVVTIYTAGAASTLLAGGSLGGVGATMSAGVGVLSGSAGFSAAALGAAAVGGAAGSIASQGAGIAMGNQQSFSWKAVGQAAMGSAITAGVGSAAQAGGVLNAIGGAEPWQAAARAALSTGANMAIHNDWNWTLVLASAVGAGVGRAIGDALGNSAFGQQALGRQGIQLAAGVAGGITGAAASGERVRYDSVFASTLGSVIGSSLGESLVANSQAGSRGSAVTQMDANTRIDNRPYAGNFPDVVEMAGRSNEGFDGYVRPGADRSGDVQVAGPYTGPTVKILPDVLITGSRLDGYGVSGGSGASAARANSASAITDRLNRESVIRETVAQLDANTGPDLDQSYRVDPGFIASSYQQGVAMLSDGEASWGDRVIGGAAATAMVPLMLLEEGGRALMNVPYHARQAGQNAAQFALADSIDDRVVAGLNFVSNFAAGFVGAGAVIPGAVSMRAPVLTANEMAVAQFPGAQATAAARASYFGNTGAAAKIGVPATRSANPLSPVLEYDAYGNEIYYRAMKESHFKTLAEDGLLTGTGETSLAPLGAYSAGYDGALVRLTVKPGTSAQLQDIGIAANQPAAAAFPGMSTRTGAWNQTSARFKVEATGVMNINDGLGIMNTQLGKGNALDIFNRNLLDFERLN